jgi:hypothetical protein
MLPVFGIFVTAATRRSSMSTIDKQRIAAVRKLEQLGYTFAGDDWFHAVNVAAAIAPTITDELHAMLMKRADDLEGCPSGSDEERELAAIERAIGAYEAVRWPTGKIAGGKG